MVLYPDLFKNQQNKIMEGFGLEFPQDADKFLDIFERFADGGAFDQLTNELCEAFPDKRESILSVPVYVDKGDENKLISWQLTHALIFGKIGAYQLYISPR